MSPLATDPGKQGPTAPFDGAAARRHEDWLHSPAGSLAQHLQHRLLVELLDPKWGETVLDVGCGTGETLRRLSDAGLRVAGVDRSPAMLEAARRKLGAIRLFVADATCLPFEDASFDAAVLNTTIEFLTDPAAAIAELTRVARRRVFVGVLNRWSFLALERQVQSRLRRDAHRPTRHYAVPEVLRMLASAGATRLRWGSVPYVPNRLSADRRVQAGAAAISGWPNPFAAYLGFAADVERAELAPRLLATRVRVVAPAKAAIARVGVGRLGGEPRNGGPGEPAMGRTSSDPLALRATCRAA